MSTTQKPEALRLADKYEIEGFLQDHRFAQDHWCRQAAAELRRQHARIAELEAQLSAIGAGGVEPLRKQAAPAALAVPMAEAWEQSAADTEHQRTGAGLHFNQGVAEGLRICAKDLRTSLAATPAAGELATLQAGLQAGLQAAAPNAPLYDPREVAFSAQPAAQGLDAETQRHAAIGKAIERACMDLPDGTEISVSLEKDAGTVTLIDQDGNEYENFSCDYGFAGVLNEAIDAAMAAQAKQRGAA